MTDQEYSQIVYALWQAGLESAERAASLHDELSKATKALDGASQKLPAEMARKLTLELPDAADLAARTIASRWTEANTHAERATAAYRKATDDARKTIYGAAAVLIGAFALALIILSLWIFPRFNELAKLREDKTHLEHTINQLTNGGGLANVQPCLDSKQRPRLCVRIDETAKVSDRGLRVINGY